MTDAVKIGPEGEAARAKAPRKRRGRATQEQLLELRRLLLKRLLEIMNDPKRPSAAYLAVVRAFLHDNQAFIDATIRASQAHKLKTLANSTDATVLPFPVKKAH